jgi:AcrR family transcriptional regulator
MSKRTRLRFQLPREKVERVSVEPAGSRSPSGSRSRRTRASLVASAHASIAATGDLSPERVARDAGVATATFYAHFASKDEAIAASLDLALTDVNGRGTRVLTIEHLLDHGLDATVRAALTGGVAGFREQHRVFRLALSRLPHDRSIRDVYRHHEQDAHRTLRRFLELASAADQIRSGDLDAMTSVLLVTLQGLNNPLLRRPEGEELIDELTRQVTGWLSQTSA